MATEKRTIAIASRTLFALISAAFLASTAGCGLEDSPAGAFLAKAVDDRSAALDEGDDATAGDLMLALLGAGLQDRITVSGDPTDCLGEDPRDKTDRHAVDEPLTPAAAKDRRDLVSGTSPDPAPEMDPVDVVAECQEGYAAFQGECLPQAIVDGLLALGMDPAAPPTGE